METNSIYTSTSQLTKKYKPSKIKLLYQNKEKLILGTSAIVLFLILWQVATSLKWVDPLFVSSPIRIVKTAFVLFKQPSFYNDLRVSGIEFISGYGLAVIIGVPLGIVMGWYKKINAIFDPFVSALYATPRIALLPLIMIWFGIGLGSKIAIVFLGAIFPMLVNTITGMRTVDADFIKASRSFGANDWQIFTTIAFPASVPLILTGLRLGLGHALIGIVVGELYAATAGIGFMMATAGSTFQTDKLMVGIIIIAISGVVLTEIIKRIEKRFERWRP